MDAEAELLTAEDLEDVKPIPGDEGWCHYCGFSWPTCFCARAKATIDALTTENATLKAALEDVMCNPHVFGRRGRLELCPAWVSFEVTSRCQHARRVLAGKEAQSE